MKAILVVAVACLLVASAYAAADCGNGKTCKGPVEGTFSDKDCKTLVGTYQEQWADGQSGGKCYTYALSKTSTKASCGSRISTRSYTQSDCEGPSSVGYSYQTGKCVQVGDNTWQKVECASASTISFSVALLALLAAFALLF